MAGNLHPNIEPKKSFLSKSWKGIVGTITALGLVWGILEGVYFFTHQWHEYQIYKEKIDSENFNERITTLENYVLEKKRSFHVGFRVFYDYDEETGITTKVKRYRDWNGIWHRIFKDNEASETYNVDYYYYISEKRGEKIYCW